MEPTEPDYDKRFTRHTPKTQGSSYRRIPDPAHGYQRRRWRELQTAMCPPPPPVMGSGAHALGVGSTRLRRRAAAAGFLFKRGAQRQAHRCTMQGGRRDASLYFSADGGVGTNVPLGKLETSTREPTGANHRGHPAASAAAIRGASPPWRLRSRRPRSAWKRPRSQRASC